MAIQLMRVPVLVFERGGHVYVYRDATEASLSIEAMDVEEGFYVAAFTASGERLQMIPRGLEVEFAGSGIFSMDELSRALSDSMHPEGATDPELWASGELSKP